MEKCNNLEEKVECFNKLTKECLDEIAPVKSFTVRSNYKFGISEETKKLMADRDQTRMKIKKSENNQKALLMVKYKKLRNLVNSRLRKETIEFNEKRISDAKNENEVWKVVNDTIHPNKSSEWCLKTDQGYNRIFEDWKSEW